MSLLLFARCEGSTFDGTNDYSAGDTTFTLNGSAAFNTDAAYLGTNGLDCPSSNSYASLTVNNHDIIKPNRGAISFRFRINTWLDQGTIFYAVGSNTNNFIRVLMNGTTGLRVRFGRNEGPVSINASMASGFTTGVWYHCIIRYHQETEWISMVVFDDSGSLIGNTGVIGTARMPIELAEIRVGDGTGSGTLDFHIDHLYISDDQLEPLYDYRSNATYQTYIGNITPTVLTRHVNPHSSGGDGTTPDLSGATAAYASLQTALNNMRGDLVANNQIVNIICATEGNLDGTNITQTTAGWKTDIYHYVKVSAATGHKANTTWSTSKYTVGQTNATSHQFAGGGNGIFNLILDGIQLGYDITNQDGSPSRNAIILILNVDTSATTETVARVIIRNCNLRIDGTKAVSYNDLGWNAIFGAPGNANGFFPVEYYIYNNILGQFANVTALPATLVRGIQVEHRVHRVFCYNNSAVGIWNNFAGGGDAGTRIQYYYNNLADGLTGNFIGATYANTRANYNATNSSDMGGTAGANDRVSQTFSFVSSTDFALTAGDTGAKGYGMTDPASVHDFNGLFLDDINGTTRVVPWDIGAFEFEVAGGSFIRQFANGYFQSAEFIESAQNFPMRMYGANNAVQVKEMREVATPTLNKLYANGQYSCPQFIEA